MDQSGEVLLRKRKKQKKKERKKEWKKEYVGITQNYGRPHLENNSAFCDCC
jgi:hypothetical protein